MGLFSACCTGVVDVGDSRERRERVREYVYEKVTLGRSTGCGVNMLVVVLLACA